MIAAFGQALQRGGYIDRSQLDLLRHRARLMGGELDRHAIEMGLLGADEVIQVYAESIELPAVRSLDLDRMNRLKSAAFSARLAARWRLIPVQQVGLSWQVLSDRRPSAQLRAEVRTTLGVELLVRAVPPFLYELLTQWLSGRSQSHDLALLAARLYPRFIVAQTLSPGDALEPSADVAPRACGLTQRLAECDSGRSCLMQAEQFLAQTHALARVWHIDGPVLRRFGDQSAALPLSELAGLESVLGADHLQYYLPVPKGWQLLCTDHSHPLRCLAIRSINLAGRAVAVAAIGAEHLSLDAAALDHLDRGVLDLKKALQLRLRQANAGPVVSGDQSLDERAGAGQIID